ncbi:MAG: hypothetical protein RTU92_13035 [Candidatus Thorarchaeota archaeon]
MLPVDAAKILAKATIVGLRSVVDILEHRTTKDTEHIYQRAYTRFSKAIAKWRESKRRGAPDFSFITHQEKHLRSDELQNIWESTARFGNLETKRIMNEKQGVVGPLNKLLNIMGAMLRDFFLCMYPLTEPIPIGQIGTRMIWGYEGDEKLGCVPVSHGADLPELDFADMIRSHCRELCRKAFILGVDSNTLSKYGLLLIRRLSVFTDYVYTNGKYGRWGFKRPRNKNAKSKQEGPHADRMLKEIVAELEAQFGKHEPQRPKPSGQLPEHDRHATSQFFHHQVSQLRDYNRDDSQHIRLRKKDWARFLEKLLAGRNPILRDKDAQYLQRVVRNRARWEGIKSHSLLTDGLPQPFNLRSIILDGSKMVESENDFLVVAEVPTDTPQGRGRADIVIFKRTVIQNPKRPGQIEVFRPIAVFDLKTRTAFNWEIKSQRRGVKKRKTSRRTRRKVVPDFSTRVRGLTDAEWIQSVKESPSRIESNQLEYYAAGIVRIYQEITEDFACVDLLKGIILIDTQYDITLSRIAMSSLIESQSRDDVVTRISSGHKRVLIQGKHPLSNRMAMILCTPNEHQIKPFSSRGPTCDDVLQYSPFSYVMKTKRRHILYLCPRAASSSGPSAAWIAKYWHGLIYLEKLAVKSKSFNFVWLDLAGTLSHRNLARSRLRIEMHDSKIQNFFERIHFVDLSNVVNDFLFNQGSPLNIDDVLSGISKNRDAIIVVSGWDWVEESTPFRLRTALNELERIIIEGLNNTGCTSIWFAVPKRGESTSWKYHQHSFLPFKDTSHHSRYVTDLVWSLPVRPYALTHTVPMFDDLRVIIEHKEDSVEKQVVIIPSLENWSSRFWSRRSKRRVKTHSNRTGKGRPKLTAQDAVENEQFVKELIEDSLELIPWLRVLHPTEFDNPESSDDPIDIMPKVTLLADDISKPLGVMSRMMYHFNPKGIGHGRGYVATRSVLPTIPITHPRHYRENSIKSKRISQSTKSPDELILEAGVFREETVQRRELRRLQRVLKMFSLITWHSQSWTDLISSINSLISKSDSGNREILNRIVNTLRSHKTSSSLWDTLSWTREEELGEGVRLSVQTAIRNLQGCRSNISNLYGNYLFLILLAVSIEYPKLKDDQLKKLWKILRPWLLIQFGFKTQKVQSPKFDARAIWINMRKRAQVLVGVQTPTQSDLRKGQLVTVPSGDGDEYWLFLENRYDTRKLDNGLWIGSNPLEIRGIMRWAESEHRMIAKKASEVSKSAEKHIIVVSVMGDSEYLWIHDYDEWKLVGRLSVISRKRDAISSIRGIRIDPIQEEIVPSSPHAVSDFRDFGKRIRGKLKELSQLRKHLYHVECRLHIQDSQYLIKFWTGNELIDSLTLTNTSDLLRVLRRPLIEGIPLQSSQDTSCYMTWNVYDGIEYGELQLLRPYVERRVPYIYIRVPLPMTCDELLRRDRISVSATISHSDDVCPIIDGSAREHGACWSITLDGKYSELEVRFSEPVSDSDIVSLMDAGEIFLEQTRFELSFSYDKDPDLREGIVFRESWRIAKRMRKKSVVPGTFLSMDQEKLRCAIFKEETGIRISTDSITTGDRFGSEMLFEMQGEEDWELDIAIENTISKLEDIVTSYFGDGESPRDRVVDYNKLVSSMDNMLTRLYIEHLERGKRSDEALEVQVDSLRRLSQRDSIYIPELAQHLYELAKWKHRQGFNRDARKAIDESITIYERYIVDYNDPSLKSELSNARKMRTRISR